MKKFICICMLFMVWSASPAKAETSPIWDGRELVRGCDLVIRTFSGEKVSEDGNNLAFYTNGYLSGYVHAHDVSGGFQSDKGDFCLPANVYTIHLARAIVKYTQTHPEELVKKPKDIIFSAWTGAYPCMKK
jgi:Rap1a immunity proteins